MQADGYTYGEVSKLIFAAFHYAPKKKIEAV
jgi:hypothetical protein